MENKISNDLIIKYKSDHLESDLRLILKILNPVLKKKAEYIFFKKYYPKSLYHPCLACKLCEVDKKDMDNENCKDCDKCTCQHGFFNLRKLNACEYEDVYDDLILEVLRLIENYDISKDFDKYFYACIWNWMPSFLTKNFIQNIHLKSLYSYNIDGEESEQDIIDEKTLRTNNFSIDEILEICKNPREKQIIHLILKTGKFNQAEIAKKLGISRQAVNKIVKKLKLKIKNRLTNSTK